MKKLFTVSAFCLAALAVDAQVRMPQPSSNQHIKQEFGQGMIELNYSRPSAKGRAVYGNLVPYGKLWRTGANAATRISFNEPVQINGKNIDTGSYALYTIPGESEWTIILNKGYKNSGTSGYTESDDVVRFNVKPTKIQTPVETFTIQFANVEAMKIDVQIAWEKTMVSFPIATNFTDKLRAEIEEALKGEKKPYWQAAQFYNDYDKNYAKALENVNKVLESNDKAFWVWLFKARVQEKMGDYVGAISSAEKSLALATEAKNDDYIKMNKELIAEAKKKMK